MMKISDFYNSIKQKVSEKEYTFSDNHWEGFKLYKQQQENQRKRRLLFFYNLGFAILLLISFFIWPFDKTTNHQQISSKAETAELFKNGAESLSVTTDTATATDSNPIPSSSSNPNSRAKIPAASIKESTNSSLMLNAPAKMPKTYSALKSENNSRLDAKGDSRKDLKLTHLNKSEKESISRNVKYQMNKTTGVYDNAGSLSLRALLVDSLPIKERDIYISSTSTEIFSKRVWSIMGYTQLYMNDISFLDNGNLTSKNIWSSGLMVHIRQNNRISIALGLGYQQESLELLAFEPSIQTSLEPEINTVSEQLIQSSSDWVYRFDFDNGNALLVDSNLITTYDTTLVTKYDTTLVNKNDTVISGVEKNYTLGSIELPIMLNYTLPLGRWEIVGSTGLHFNYRVFTSLTNSYENPSSDQFKTASLDASFKLGAYYSLSPNFSVGLSPIMRMGLMNTGTLDNNQWRIRKGMMLNIRYSI